MPEIAGRALTELDTFSRFPSTRTGHHWTEFDTVDAVKHTLDTWTQLDRT